MTALLLRRFLRRQRRLLPGLLAALAACGLLALSLPAQAVERALTTAVSPVQQSVENGGQLSFRISYACSALRESCAGTRITAPPPQGTPPGGGEPVGVVPGSGSGIANNHVAGVETDEDGSVVFRMRDLPGGTTGQVTVVWKVPNTSVVPGTAYRQHAEISAPGIATAEADSAPVTTTAGDGQIRASLSTREPVSPALVTADKDVVYRAYDCNPGTTALGGLDYRDLTLTLTLPEGVEISSATGGGTVRDNTVTWTVADPATNSCDDPGRSYEATVRYPSAVFVPEPSVNPQPVNVTARLDARATSLNGTALSAQDEVQHTFTGRPLNSVGTEWLYYNKWGGGAASQNLTWADTSSLFSFAIGQYWWMDNPGRVRYPGVYQSHSMLDRMPCVRGGQAVSPPAPGTDPLAGAFPGELALPGDQCQAPAFSTEYLAVRDIMASTVAQIEVATWDGTEGRVHRWTPPEQRTEGYYLKTHTSSPARPTAQDSASATRTGLDHGGPGGGEGVGQGGAEGPAPSPRAEDPLYDGTMTDPVTYDLGLPDGETVTDVRVVYGHVPYHTWAYVGVYGHATEEFAALGQPSMTNTVRAYESRNRYGDDDPPGWGNLLVGNPYAKSEAFLRPQPDPQITKKAATPVTALHPGAQTEWTVTLANGPGGTPLNPKPVELLPPGLTLVPGSVRWTNLEMLDGVEPALATTTVPGARFTDGRDRTALTWSWPAAQRLDNPQDTDSPDHPFYESGTLPTLTFATRVAADAPEGDHQGEEAQSITLFDGERDIDPQGRNVPQDTYDLDEDGNAQERVARASVAWSSVATSGATVRKSVKGALDEEFGSEGRAAGVLDPAGSSAEYRITVTNDNSRPIADTVIYDILPYPGDTAISEALGGEPRQSAWQPVFRRMTQVPPGMAVAYSRSTDPCRPELFDGPQPGCVDDWSATPPADPGEVRALRLTLPGPYGPTDDDNPPLHAQFEVGVPPVDPEGSTGTADNNAAWRTSRVEGQERLVLRPAEAPLTRLDREAGRIGGLVWKDQNRDGLRDEGEPLIPGVRVALLDADGEPVRSASGDPLTAVTDREGAYGFTVPLGDYRVRFSDWPAVFSLTAMNAGSDPDRDSDADPETGISERVSLTAESPESRHVDAGLLKSHPKPSPSPTPEPTHPGPGGELPDTGGPAPAGGDSYLLPLSLAAAGLLASGALLMWLRRRVTRA
ncbi:SdrD B-like domain-containing protein [Streptomyces albidoflavus]